MHRAIVFAAAAVAALALPAAAAAAAAAPRDGAAPPPRAVVSLDLGWRFRRGPPPAPPGPCLLGTNYTGLQCDGLSAVTAAGSAAECAAVCCADASCELWQWSDTPAPGGGCWVGDVPAGGCNPGREWVSFGNATRNGAPGDVPAWAALNFADGAGNWTVVDAPHDFIITGADENASPYVNDSSLKGQAFIPKTVGVYRKHFALPADWQGRHVELYCEGMYAYATWYLNGQPLGVHALGYTSYYVRLDNVTGGLFYDGRHNVLAVLVDATSGRDTGWWFVHERVRSPSARGGGRTSLTPLPNSSFPRPPTPTPAGTRAAGPCATRSSRPRRPRRTSRRTGCTRTCPSPARTRSPRSPPTASRPTA